MNFLRSAPLKTTLHLADTKPYEQPRRPANLTGTARICRPSSCKKHARILPSFCNENRQLFIIAAQGFIVTILGMTEKRNIALSHGSAERYWRTTDPRGFWYARESRANPLLKCAIHTDELLACRGYRGTDGRAHLLVPETQKRNNLKGVCFHACSTPLPEGSFFDLGDGVFVSAPWLCLAQLARHKSEVQLIELASNLCSRYVIESETGKIVTLKQAVFTRKKFIRQLSKLDNVRGVSKAQKCAQQMVENAMSPMEIKTALVLCLPPRMGGYGIPRPMLNLSIKPGKRRDICHQDSFEGDLVWRNEKFVVEYDGEEHHQDHRRDSRRRNSLDVLEWTTKQIFKDDIYNVASFEKTAQQIANHLNHRIYKPSNWFFKHVALREELGLLPSNQRIWIDAEREGWI